MKMGVRSVPKFRISMRRSQETASPLFFCGIREPLTQGSNRFPPHSSSRTVMGPSGCCLSVPQRNGASIFPVMRQCRGRPFKERSGMGICLKKTRRPRHKEDVSCFYLYKLRPENRSCRFLRAREQVLLHGEALHTHGGAANPSSDENKTPRRVQSGDGNPPFLQPYAALHPYVIPLSTDFLGSCHRQSFFPNIHLKISKMYGIMALPPVPILSVA